MNTVIEKLVAVLQKEFLNGNVIIKYEDFVVKAFLTFPNDFCLDGHPEYPDSNKINKEVYGRLRTKGLIRVSNKQIELTEIGRNEVVSLNDSYDTATLSREERIEYSRIMNLEGLRLFFGDKKEKLIKQDFYYLFKINAGSKKQDIVGAIVVIKNYLSIFKNKNVLYHEKLIEYSEYLIRNFSE